MKRILPIIILITLLFTGVAYAGVPTIFKGKVVTKANIVALFKGLPEEKQLNGLLKDSTFYNAKAVIETGLKLTAKYPATKDNKIVSYDMTVNGKKYTLAKGDCIYIEKTLWVSRLKMKQIAADQGFYLDHKGTALTVKKAGLKVKVDGVELTGTPKISMEVMEGKRLQAIYSNTDGKEVDLALAMKEYPKAGACIVETNSMATQLYLLDKTLYGDKQIQGSPVKLSYTASNKKVYSLSVTVDVVYNAKRNGNLMSNLQSNAFVVGNGNKTFYVNPYNKSENRLIEVGTAKSPEYLNAGYYLNYGYGRVFSIDKEDMSIKSLSLVNKKMETITKTKANNLKLNGEWLYFSSIENQNMLYRVPVYTNAGMMDSIRKEEKVVIGSIFSGGISFSDTHLYFLDTKYTIRRIPLNQIGKSEWTDVNAEVFMQEPVKSFIVENNKLYYVDNAGVLKTVGLTPGGTAATISIGAALKYAVAQDGSIYYLDDKGNLFRHANGSTSTIISEMKVNTFNLVGSNVYFFAEGDQATLYVYSGSLKKILKYTENGLIEKK